MIQVILLILKIIGITLLVILGLLLALLALVLFAPIVYRVRVIHNPEQTKVTAKVRFLTPLLLVTVQYLKKLSYRVRVFGIPILDSEKPKKENKKPKQKKPKQKMPKQKEETPPPEDIFVPLENPGALPEWKPETEQEHPKSEQQPEEPVITEKKKGFFEKIKGKIQKIRETICNLINKIKKLLHQKDELVRILGKEETKQAVAFAWEKLKRLLKHVFPRKLKGYVVYGADNPATTGQVLGILSVVYAKTGQLLEIRPNFQEKQLECDVLIKGHIQVFTLLVIAIKVVLNKELRQLLKEIKNVKEIE